jgi:sigma-70-like protein
MDRDHLIDLSISTDVELTSEDACPPAVDIAASIEAAPGAATVVGPDPAAAPDVPVTSRKVRRRGRRTRMRSKTIAMKRLTKEEMRLGALLYPPVDEPRPRTRAECKDVPRPCPFVSCKHHLYLDVNPETGSIKLNFPDLEVWEMTETCSLDIADRNGITLEEVGDIMNLTRERIRQVEVRGLLKLKMMTPLGDPED